MSTPVNPTSGLGRLVLGLLGRSLLRRGLLGRSSFLAGLGLGGLRSSLRLGGDRSGGGIALLHLRLLAAGEDVGDADDGQLGAEAALALRVLAAALLEGDDLLATGLLDDLTGDGDLGEGLHVERGLLTFG